MDQVWATFVIAHQCWVGEAESCPAITGGYSVCQLCDREAAGSGTFGSVKGVKQGTKTSRHKHAVSFSPSP